MPVKATVRRPASTPAAATPAPAGTGTGTGPVIDVEAHVVDETSADALAAQLESGTPVPGSEEETQAHSEAGAAEAPVPATALAPRPPAELNRYEANSGGGFEGEFDQSDIRLPQVKIVNGSGELSQKFNQGTLLYADEKVWDPPNLENAALNPQLCFVPMQIRKQWRENLSDEEVQDGAMPRTVNTVAEAEALSGIGCCEWQNGQKGKWSPSARCVFLLQAPEKCDHPGFCSQLDGKLWALAVYYAGGTAYNETAKQIFNTAQISLKENGRVMLHKKVWTLKVFKKMFKNGRGVYLPKITLSKEETGPDVRELAASLTTSGRKIEAQE